MSKEFVPCLVKQLPEDQWEAAGKTAVEVNATNAPPAAALQMVQGLAALLVNAEMVLTPGRLSLLTSKYWGTGGVKLSVSFLDNPAADLRDRILSHMSAWGEFSNVKFTWSQSQGKVRISRGQGGFWSYLGTDVLHIPAGQQTMNLQGFTMSTPEKEYLRVVRHETGHTLGFPHEQQLPEIVADLDVEKTIAWGAQVLGWDASMVRSQILTPLDPRSIRMTAHADRNGIMCYALPSSITKSGNPIPGGTDIDDIDRGFAASIYPLEVKPPEPPKPPPPPPTGGTDMLAKIIALIAALKAKDWVAVITIIAELIASIQAGQVKDTEVADVEQALMQYQRQVAKTRP